MSPFERLLLGVLYLEIFVLPCCSLFVGNASSAIQEYVNQATVVADGFLYVSGGNLIYKKGHGYYYHNRTIRIDLKHSWTVFNVTAETLPGPKSQYRGAALFYDRFNKEIYSYDDDLIMQRSIVEGSPALNVLNLSRSPPTWSAAASQPGASIRSSFRGMYAKGSRYFFALGGQRNIVERVGQKNKPNTTNYIYSGMALYDMYFRNWTIQPTKSMKSRNSYGQYFHGYGAGGCGLFVPYFGIRGMALFLGGLIPKTQEYTFPAFGAEVLALTRPHWYTFRDESSFSHENWLHTRTTTPSGTYINGRENFCIVGALDPTKSPKGGYDIFMYGGELGVPTQSINTIYINETVQDFSSVWVLTLPTFQWIRIPGSETPKRNRTRTFHSCEVIGNRFMVLIGGVDTTLNIIHHHNGPSKGYQLNFEKSLTEWMSSISIFDMTKLQWVDTFDANAGPYERSDYITNIANIVKIVKGSGDIQYFQLNYTRFANSTNSVQHSAGSSGKGNNKNPASNTQNADTSSSLSSGAIAGIVVGIVAALVLIALAVYFYRKSKSKKKQQAQQSHQSDTFEASKRDLPGELADNSEKHELPPKQGETELPSDQKIAELPLEHFYSELPGDSPQDSTARNRSTGNPGSQFPEEKSESWWAQTGEPTNKTQWPRFEEVT